MAPTLNCTVGDPAANSYVCLDEAEQIAANIPGGDEWIALTEEEKIFSLIAATALLETLQYRGEICSASQQLVSRGKAKTAKDDPSTARQFRTRLKKRR